MIDKSSGADSQEYVALRLLQIVGEAEKKFYPDGQVMGDTNRKWVLDTYAECLEAARGARDV